MKLNGGAIVGLVLIGGTLAFCGSTFKSALINYVPFAQARAATDTSVQIMGAPVAGTMQYDSAAHDLHFTVRDTQGALMPVVFKGPKPEDLDTAMTKATKITAQGTYDKAQQVFVADNLLVKCPSKYQGAGGSGGDRSYGSS